MQPAFTVTRADDSSDVIGRFDNRADAEAAAAEYGFGRYGDPMAQVWREADRLAAHEKAAAEEAESLVGDRVRARDGSDSGTVHEARGRRVLVGWDSGATTWTPVDLVDPE